MYFIQVIYWFQLINSFVKLLHWKVINQANSDICLHEWILLKDPYVALYLLINNLR